MLARVVVHVIKWVSREGCAVLKYFRAERNQCLVLCLSLQAHQSSFFPVRGPDQRRAAGGDGRVLCRSDLLSLLKHRGRRAGASPHFPFAAGKRVPRVARAAAGGGCCLGAAKAKGPRAGLALFARPKAPPLGVLVLPRHRLGVVLVRQMVSFSICKMEMPQCTSAVLVLWVIASALPRPEILQEPD